MPRNCIAPSIEIQICENEQAQQQQQQRRQKQLKNN